MEKFLRTRLGLFITANDKLTSTMREQYDEELRKAKSALDLLKAENAELSSTNASLLLQIESLQEKLDEEPKANKPGKLKRKSSEYKDVSPEEPESGAKKAKKSPPKAAKAASSARFMRLRGRHT